MMEVTPPTPLPRDTSTELRRAARLLVAARHAVALTGAGVSVESGIPPFRGPGGLWTTHGEPPPDGYQRFLRDPAASWRERLAPTEPWAVVLHEKLSLAEPNIGHIALAELEGQGLLSALITQNIDALHERAGSRKVLEIHGNFRKLRCITCATRFDADELPVDPTDLPPRCPRCGGIIKGDTVQFGEPIPEHVLRRCFDAVGRCDCMLVIGTSATVTPAAEFPLDVLRRGGVLIEINPDQTELSPFASLSLRGPAGAMLKQLLTCSLELRAKGSSP